MFFYVVYSFKLCYAIPYANLHYVLGYPVRDLSGYLSFEPKLKEDSGSVKLFHATGLNPKAHLPFKNTPNPKPYLKRYVFKPKTTKTDVFFFQN